MGDWTDSTDSTDVDYYHYEYHAPDIWAKYLERCRNRIHGMKYFQSELGRQGFFQRRHFPIQSAYFFKLKNHPTIFAN